MTTTTTMVGAATTKQLEHNENSKTIVEGNETVGIW